MSLSAQLQSHTGGLLPDSAPILISPAESVCTENHGALNPANLLPSDAGPLGAVYFNVWTSWPRFALCFPAGGLLPLDFPFPSTHSLPGTDFAHCWPPRRSFLSRKAVPRRPWFLQSRQQPPVRRLGEEEGLEDCWLLPARQAFTREIKTVPKC